MFEKALKWVRRLFFVGTVGILTFVGLFIYSEWTMTRVYKKAVVEANKVCPDCGDYCGAEPKSLCVFEQECGGSERWRENYLLLPFPSTKLASCSFIRGRHPDLGVDFLIIDGALVAGYRWRTPPKPADGDAGGMVSVFNGTEERELVRCWRDGAPAACPQ